LESRDLFLAATRVFFFSGTYPASYSMDIKVASSGVKQQGREADHSLPSSAEVKNGGAMPGLPHML
jgi:hypothetical protein